MGRKKDKPDFDEYYAAIFKERWEGLRQALAGPGVREELTKGLLRPYFLDPASRMAAEALQVKPGDRVLDLCAAPGGKTLVLALALGKAAALSAGDGGMAASCVTADGVTADGTCTRGMLTANERSADRRRRLVNVLTCHLSPDLLARVRVTGRDALTWGLSEKDAYDKILLDAPCSSERHVLASPAHLARWGPARTKHLSVQAYAMLLSAYMALVPGGTVLYCTCALSPLENDGVVGRVLKKHGEGALSEAVSLPGGEATEFGVILLPDRAKGSGPLYLAKIRKRA